MKIKYCDFQKINSIQKLMCIALSAEDIKERCKAFRDLYSDSISDELYKKAHLDEVDSHVAYLMLECNIQIPEKFKISYENVEKKIKGLLNELDYVANKLNEKNIKIIALKNAGIARGIYQNAACSPMGDIDLLVSTEDFRVAHAILTNQLGYTFKFRSTLEEEDITTAFLHGGTEYYKIVDGREIWLELQWRPIAGRWIQPFNEPKGSELINSSIQIENSNVRILAPDDNLLQVCLHTAKHSFVRAPGFRLHSDVDRIVRFTKIDWDKFLDKVKNLKVKTATYFSLGLAKYLLNTPVPEHVLFSLQPNFLRGNVIRYFLKKAGIFDQKKRKFTKVGYIIFNMALFDSVLLLIKAIFPSTKDLQEKHEIKSVFLIPYYYLLRIKNLIFQREGI